MGDLEVTKGPGPLGVHHPLRYPLPVEVGQLLNESMVLQQERTPGTNTDTVELVTNGGTMGGGQLLWSLVSKHIDYP